MSKSKNQYNGVVKTQVIVELNANEFVHHTNRATLIEFIKDLDFAVADWDFTQELYKHFAELEQQRLEEEKAFERIQDERKYGT